MCQQNLSVEGNANSVNQTVSQVCLSFSQGTADADVVLNVFVIGSDSALDQFGQNSFKKSSCQGLILKKLSARAGVSNVGSLRHILCPRWKAEIIQIEKACIIL